MKNWQDELTWRIIAGILLTAAYTLAILILPVLAMSICGVDGGPEFPSLKNVIEVNELFLDKTFVFPVLLVSLITAQVVMLSLSLNLSRGKPRSRLNVWIPLSTAGLLLAELHFWAVAAVFCGIWGLEKGFDYMFLGLAPDSFTGIQATVTIVEIWLWIVWALVLWRLTRTKKPVALFMYLLKWLATGSVLVLLVAIITQIARKDLERAGMNYFSVTAGLGVLLLCIAPWLILRSRHRQPHADAPEP